MFIERFELERIQSEWEHRVKYNLAESGVHPLHVRDLLGEDGIDEIMDMPLGYAQTNGPEPLRERISLLYPGSEIDNILVTNGTAEANFISTWSALDKGDEMVCMLPNYMQIYGIARALGAVVKPMSLKEDLGWAPDLDQLAQLVSSRTKMIAVCNPNNPTGAVLSEEAMERIVHLASKADAWILADEVYRGAELDRKRTPSFWGRYDKVLAIAGLSKAFGLPGLRIGWIVGPKAFVERAWGYHDYTTIAAGTLSYHLAYLALEPEMRERILNRSQAVLNENLGILQAWVAKHDDLLSLIPPRAGAMSFVHYNLKINSSELSKKLHREKSVLTIPGDCYNMDHFLRLGYGEEKEKLIAALDLIGETLEELRG
ncbi:MAG TPA: aminotransferase class I/II-fold pyridoxal phosphate-dependent enzyme [Candidatus Acetothermia bacterium]|nr:aminotransferase class I/II-fold pyridoxal phosphate-dependent enzyme [Candidatus Acetothermia bacterium]